VHAVHQRGTGDALAPGQLHRPQHARLPYPVDAPDQLLGVGGEGVLGHGVLFDGGVLEGHLGGGQRVEAVVDLGGRGGGQTQYGDEGAHAEHGAE
jgi:hypothetical protein